MLFMLHCIACMCAHIHINHTHTQTQCTHIYTHITRIYTPSAHAHAQNTYIHTCTHIHTHTHACSNPMHTYTHITHPAHTQHTRLYVHNTLAQLQLQGPCYPRQARLPNLVCGRLHCHGVHLHRPCRRHCPCTLPEYRNPRVSAHFHSSTVSYSCASPRC